MSGALTLRFTTQAQLDIRRMNDQLSDLQRQIASSEKSNDLRGYGGGASRLLDAQSLKASADSRQSAIEQIVARFDVQATALDQAATGASNLALAIRNAVSADDGRGLGVELSVAFSSVVSGLNQTWNGQALFAGERTGSGGPITINSLDDLLNTPTSQIYNEAQREQTFQLSVGPPIPIASKASDISTDLFDTFRAMKMMLNGAGGELGAPLTDADKSTLLDFASQLDKESGTLVNEEGKAGQLSKRFTDEATRLQGRSDLLTKEVSTQSQVDLASVSVQLNSLMTQYQAAAKTFADLSKLSLLNYL